MQAWKAVSIGLVGIMASFGSALQAQTTPSVGVTYQGELKQFGSPVNGPLPMVFKLWNASTGGAQTGATRMFYATVINP